MENNLSAQQLVGSDIHGFHTLQGSYSTFSLLMCCLSLCSLNKMDFFKILDFSCVKFKCYLLLCVVSYSDEEF